MAVQEATQIPLERVSELPTGDATAADEITADTTLPTPRLHLKLASAGLSFFCAGMNDGSLGALVPYILRTYNISTDIISIVFGTTFAGWLTVALVNAQICVYLNLGSLLTLGAALQLTAQVLRCWLPPFPLYAVTFFLQSLGMALQDTHANNWVASIKLAHRWLGFIHACYALGLFVGPFIATPIASAGATSMWYLYYTSLVGIGLLNLVLTIIAFRETLVLRIGRNVTVSPSTTSVKAQVKATLTNRGVWLLSLYFFCFLGAVLTASGWVVEYLVSVRGGQLSKVGYVQTGFSGGLFLGRVLLAEPTKRFGERRMIFVYAVICLGLELLFWLVPNIVAGAVAISIFGFFAGPFFATGVSVGSQLFPSHLRSNALSTVFMLGQVGGAIFPAITGLIASRVGVQTLQPILVGLCSATALVWLLVPKPAQHLD